LLIIVSTMSINSLPIPFWTSRHSTTPMNIRSPLQKSLILLWLAILILTSCNLSLVGSLLTISRKHSTILRNLQRGEPVASDELYTDTPAIDNGSTRCQIFVGMNTDVVNIYPMKFSKQFVNTLEDNVRFGGAPTKLVSDRAQLEISSRALKFLRVYGISANQMGRWGDNQRASEPHRKRRSCHMCYIRIQEQPSWHWWMATIQVNCMTTEEVHTYGQTSVPLIILLISQIQIRSWGSSKLRRRNATW